MYFNGKVSDPHFFADPDPKNSHADPDPDPGGIPNHMLAFSLMKK